MSETTAEGDGDAGSEALADCDGEEDTAPAFGVSPAHRAARLAESARVVIPGVEPGGLDTGGPQGAPRAQGIRVIGTELHLQGARSLL